MQNIVDALQKDGVKKTAVERSLASLVEKGAVTKKEYGKAKIFIRSQKDIQLPDMDESKALDAQLRDLSSQHTDIVERVNILKSQVNTLRQTMTLEEAQTKLEQKKKELESKEEQRAQLGDGTSLMTNEEKTKLEQAYFDARSSWKKYKRIVIEMVNQVSEASGKRPAQLFEEIGVETDKDVNVNIIDFPDIPNPSKQKQTKRLVKRQRVK